MNLKLPAVLNALKIADVKQGTQEADAVSGVAVAVSSLTTMIIIAIGALLLTPLKPILELPQVVTGNAIRPASFIWMSDALHLQQKRRWQALFSTAT